MTKKVILILTAVLMALSFGIANAGQLNGMVSGQVVNAGGIGAPVLPANLFTFVNPGGTGDALIYPYYNVRDNKVVYFNIVNTDTVNGVAVKLRFREAATITDACDSVDAGSIEVLDFHVCLSAGDVYTGAIVTDSATGAGKFVSLDTDTLTDPTVPSAGVVFRSGSANPVDGITADNTREGYFEVLSYGVWDETQTTCTTADLTGADAPNAIMGFAFIHDEDTNATYAYNATAIADCRFEMFDMSLTNEYFNLTNCQDTAGANTVDTVDYAMTKKNLLSSYVVYDDIDARTAVLITFPTKMLNQCIEVDTLFDDPTVQYSVWDDQENTITPQGDFSPTVTVTNQLPHEVNVLNIKKAAMFTSDVSGIVDTSTFEYGWIGIDLAIETIADGVSDETVLADPVVTFGLPAIGLVFTDASGEAISWALPTAYDTLIDDGTGAQSSP